MRGEWNLPSFQDWWNFEVQILCNGGWNLEGDRSCPRIILPWGDMGHGQPHERRNLKSAPARLTAEAHPAPSTAFEASAFHYRRLSVNVLGSHITRHCSGTVREKAAARLLYVHRVEARKLFWTDAAKANSRKKNTKNTV